MPFSWRIATVSGIPIYLHGTFLILLAFVFVSDWTRGGTIRSALGGASFMAAIFGTVVLHELGHALTARRFGIRTSRSCRSAASRDSNGFPTCRARSSWWPSPVQL
jgi:Zn-dependent protease